MKQKAKPDCSNCYKVFSMKILEKINPKKILTLLMFYIAMAMSIVYFDLFQSIEFTENELVRVENPELVIEEYQSLANEDFDLEIDKSLLIKITETNPYHGNQFQNRLFHENRNIAHQFKEKKNKQLHIDFYSHQQIALIISHQKVEEEGIAHLS